MNSYNNIINSNDSKYIKCLEILDYIIIRVCSSEAEQLTFNQPIVGSNPTRPTYKGEN